MTISDTTFPRSARLLHAQDFSTVFRKGRFLRKQGGVRVRCAETRATCARLGVIVPKKGNRLAARRNRIKRIVRDKFRNNRSQLPVIDIIVHVTGPYSDGDLAQLLDQCFTELARENTQ